jgi:hypothetical protein
LSKKLKLDPQQRIKMNKLYKKWNCIIKI